MAFIIIYITNPDELTANKVADHLLDKKLIACANVFPITSAYWWQGSLERENEFVALVKTQPKHWHSIQEEINAIHPYDVPCIMKLEAEANEAYENWIFKMTE